MLQETSLGVAFAPSINHSVFFLTGHVQLDALSSPKPINPEALGIGSSHNEKHFWFVSFLHIRWRQLRTLNLKAKAHGSTTLLGSRWRTTRKGEIMVLGV